MISSASPHAIIAITVILTALAIVAVILRVYERRRKELSLWIDDILSVVALILFVIVFTIPVIISAVKARLGDHAPTGPNGMILFPSAVFNATHFTYLTFSTIPLGFARASILFLYKRIFRGPVFNVVAWVMIFLVAAWSISFFLSLLLQCIPVTTSSVQPPTSHCFDIVPVTYSITASGVILDFMIMVTPWPNVWRLHMKTKQKVAVIGIFLLGALTIGASLARCIIIFQIGKAISAGDLDYTYYDGANIVWAVAECALAIISSCLPTFGRYLRGWTIHIDFRALSSAFRFRYVGHDSQHRIGSTSSLVELDGWRTNGAPPRKTGINTATARSSAPSGKKGVVEDGIVVSQTWGLREVTPTNEETSNSSR